jgi:GNAT superfamily N-acetyltransferase
MDIEIRKLAPDLAEDYARFFDVTPHDVRLDKDKAELPCYCVTWRSDDSYVGNGDHWFMTREERRERAIQFIKRGSLQGYLAYRGDEVVGWCNANANCQGCVNYIRSYYPVAEHNPDVKVKSIFCFLIAPGVQRMGVATKLVERVCQDAAADGFDFVEAYTVMEYAPPDARGPLQMYEKCGFITSDERDGKVVVRKSLK